MTKKKAVKKVVVNLDAKPRKKTVPKTAYTKENPSPFAFKPGESGNSAGKKRNETRLLSKALNVFLSDHAPDELAKAMGLPPNTADGAHFRYSHAQCLAKRILNLAIRGEAWAVSEVARLTEPVNARLGVFGFSGEGEEERSPIMELVMVSADGDGRISKEADAISTRTKAALAAAKARGVKLGGNRGKIASQAVTGAKASALVRLAKVRKRNADLLPFIQAAREKGATSLRQIAAMLNEKGIPGPRSGPWHANSVRRVIAREDGSAAA